MRKNVFHREKVVNVQQEEAVKIANELTAIAYNGDEPKKVVFIVNDKPYFGTEKSTAFSMPYFGKGGARTEKVLADFLQWAVPADYVWYKQVQDLLPAYLLARQYIVQFTQTAIWYYVASNGKCDPFEIVNILMEGTIFWAEKYDAKKEGGAVLRSQFAVANAHRDLKKWISKTISLVKHVDSAEVQRIEGVSEMLGKIYDEDNAKAEIEDKNAKDPSDIQSEKDYIISKIADYAKRFIGAASNGEEKAYRECVVDLALGHGFTEKQIGTVFSVDHKTVHNHKVRFLKGLKKSVC